MNRSLLPWLIAGAVLLALAAAGAGVALMSNWPSDWLALGAPYLPTINALEAQYGIPQNLLAALAYQESTFNPSAVNPASGATGMFQLMPQFYPGAGASWSADAASAAAALAGYYAEFGTWQQALAAYNWGPGNLQTSGAVALAQLPSETQGYVSSIVAAVPVPGPFLAA